jgi:hypothetical protein
MILRDRKCVPKGCEVSGNIVGKFASVFDRKSAIEGVFRVCEMRKPAGTRKSGVGRCWMVFRDRNRDRKFESCSNRFACKLGDVGNRNRRLWTCIECAKY